MTEEVDWAQLPCFYTDTIKVDPGISIETVELVLELMNRVGEAELLQRPFRLRFQLRAADMWDLACTVYDLQDECAAHHIPFEVQRDNARDART